MELKSIRGVCMMVGSLLGWCGLCSRGMVGAKLGIELSATAPQAFGMSDVSRSEFESLQKRMSCLEELVRRMIEDVGFLKGQTRMMSEAADHQRDELTDLNQLGCEARLSRLERQLDNLLLPPARTRSDRKSVV